MPTKYLTVAELVDRIGNQEATRLTSEVQPPARDDVKLERAIEDAEEEADGYISRRYVLPLLETPKVLKTWIAALAREKLFKVAPVPEAKDAADRARAQLREVSIGTFVLRVEDSAAVETTGDRLAMTSGDRKTDTVARQLRDFTDLSGGGYCANWRR
jgi:phage gp36-like protein